MTRRLLIINLQRAWCCARLLVGLGLGAARPAAAQKVVETKVWTTYHKTPTLDLPARYKTYGIAYDFGASKLQVPALPELKGLRFKARDADVVLKVTVKGLYIAGRNRIRHESKGLPTQYSYQLYWQADYGYEVIDTKAKTLVAAFRGEGASETTNDYKSQAELDAYVQGPYLPALELALLGRVLERLDFDLLPHDYRVEVAVSSVEGSQPAHAEIAATARALTEALASAPVDRARLAPLAAVWQQYLARADWSNKKSEINKDVANALLGNLCIAYLLAEDYPSLQASARTFTAHNKGLFSKRYPTFKGDENYNGPSTSYLITGASQILRGATGKQPTYYSIVDYEDFAYQLLKKQP